MPDSQPNYLTQNANGDVGGVFPGGVQIFAGTSNSPPDERQVRWIRDDNGLLVANLKGYIAGPGGPQSRESWLEARGIGLDRGFVSNIAESAGGPIAQILLSSDVLTPQARVLAVAGVEQRIVIDNAQQSSFVQCQGGARKLRLSMGVAFCTVASSVPVAHGLGNTPTAAVASPYFTAGNRVTGHVYNVDATYVYLLNTTADGSNINMFWMALG